jgi:3-hydroxyisobutyrate dehydrogenase
MVQSSQKVVHLGFIGIGRMGLPMTARLIAAGHNVTVWDVSSDRIVAAEKAGAIAATHAAEVADRAEIVFLCLTDGAAVEKVIFGLDGIALAHGQDKVVVDLSSIHPDSTRNIAARLKAANGMAWIDAPVSGGPKGAAEGTLAVMAGGQEIEIERIRPYVLAMGQRLTRMGDVGAGQTTKLCNQVIAACSMVVMAEATRLAVDAGIDATRLPEALAGGFADSIPLQLFVPRMAEGVSEPRIGPVSIILKDLEMIADVARTHSTPLPMAGLAAQMFRFLKAARGSQADVLEIYELSKPKLA